jgi:hypothetical protein
MSEAEVKAKWEPVVNFGKHLGNESNRGAVASFED